MAQLNLRALAVVIGCAALLPVACNGDDDSGNPTPGTGGTGGKGGTGGNGGSSATGGKGGSSTGESGSAGEAGSGATSGGSGHDCTAADKVTYNCGTTAHPLNIECFADCNATKTDDSAYFMNRCPDGTDIFGGVKSACQPWTATLSKLGSGCTALGPGCTLPALP